MSRCSLRRSSEGGVTLAALMLAVAIMSVLLTSASQQWSFLVRRELEAELIFRGERLARAMERWSKAHGNAIPVQLEALTKQPNAAIRAIPPDPLTARFDRSGELLPGTGEWVVVGAVPAAVPGARVSGPIKGIRSSSDLLSIRGWNGKPANSPYLEWIFEHGVPMGGSGSIGKRPPEPTPPPGFPGLRAPGSPPVGPPKR